MARIVYHLVQKNVEIGSRLEDSAHSIARFNAKEGAIEVGKKKGKELRADRKDAHAKDALIETEYTCGHDPRKMTG